MCIMAKLMTPLSVRGKGEAPLLKATDSVSDNDASV